MSTVTNTPNQSEQVATGKLWQAGLIAAVSATVANLIVWFIESNLLGLELNVFTQGPGSPLAPVTAVMVILTSAIPAIGATLLLGILGKFVARPFMVFQVAALLFLLLSFAGPFSLPAEVALSAKLGLSVMHVVAAVVIVWVLNQYGRS